jgi:hypothetical protein
MKNDILASLLFSALLTLISCDVVGATLNFGMFWDVVMVVAVVSGIRHLISTRRRE